MTTAEKIEQVQLLKISGRKPLGKLLNKTYRFMGEISGIFLRERGYQSLKVWHLVALMHIDTEGSNVNTLAQKAGMTKQGMSKLIKELLDNGYVSTEKDANDARALVVKLTDKGLDCLLDWKDCVAHVEATFSGIIGRDKLELLKEILVPLVVYYEENGLDTNLTNSPIMNMDIVKREAE
jgi:DNA-binding MarR family transcriptional regulator